MIHIIKKKIRSIGFQAFIKFVFKRLIDTVFRSKNLLYRIDLNHTDTDPEFILKDLQFFEITEYKQLEKVYRDDLVGYGGTQYLYTVKERLNIGQRLFLGILDHHVAGCFWAFVGGGKKFYTLPITENDYMLYAVFTIDKYRGLGVCTSMLSSILCQMKKDRVERVFIFTKEWNHIQKVFTKVGFQYIGKFRCLKFRNARLILWDDVIHFGIG